MFENALKEYALLVRGNPAFVGILFHAITGILIGALLFIVFNIAGDAQTNIFKFSVPYNEHHLFLLNSNFVGLSVVSVQLKALEFLALSALAIIVTSTISQLRRKSALTDALSAIRKRILGTWELRLDEFAEHNDTTRSFSCKVEFGETEARKLRVRFYESSELSINCDTPLVALYVAEGADKPDVIELSFPIEGQSRKDDKREAFLYWIKFHYLAFKNIPDMKFDGAWYQIINKGEEYRASGDAFLIPSKSA